MGKYQNDKTFRIATIELVLIIFSLDFIFRNRKFVYKTFPVEVEAYFYQTLFFKILITGSIIFYYSDDCSDEDKFLRLKIKS